MRHVRSALSELCAVESGTFREVDISFGAWGVLRKLALQGDVRLCCFVMALVESMRKGGV